MSDKRIVIKEAVIVEGRYDKAKVSGIFDTLVVETNGFQIFSDSVKLSLIRNLAEKRGIIVLTDSDGAGFVIRNYIKGSVLKGTVKHAYIPDVEGKEKRKTKYSAERKLGVEGVSDEIIRKAILSAAQEDMDKKNTRQITGMDLYEDGLSGSEGSMGKRKLFLKMLRLPEHLSAKALCKILNTLLTYEEYKEKIAMLNLQD